MLFRSHIGIFTPLIPYANARSLRLILLNQRDYRNSSPLTEPEIQALHSGDKTLQCGYVTQRVLELGEFLKWFVEHEKIPKISESDVGKVGGISVLAWSSGGCLGAPFLGLAESIPPPTRAILDEYIRSLILYGMYPVGHSRGQTLTRTSIQILPTTLLGILSSHQMNAGHP